MYDNKISIELLPDILSVSKATIKKWEISGKINSQTSLNNKEKKKYLPKELYNFPQIKKMSESEWESELLEKPIRNYNSIELFAGTGGLAIGLEKAGFNAIALNEIDSNACKTLRKNRPNWNILEGDIKDIDFERFSNIDFLSGGFPCQAFSYAGNKLGFEDTRGTLFFEFARAIKEIKPKVFLGENVRGLLSHDKGRTLESIKAVIKELGYTLIDPKVLKAIFYKVPQKRERLFLIGIRNDLVKYSKFKWPDPYHRVMVLKDALKKGTLYDTDVPQSLGQKQTERCHPEETRPLTIREYARIQTFPDNWEFIGSISSQYKQIGNAVPVNLAYTIGRRLIALLNSIEKKVEQKDSQLPIKKEKPIDQLTLF